MRYIILILITLNLLDGYSWRISNKTLYAKEDDIKNSDSIYKDALEEIENESKVVITDNDTNRTT